MSEYLVVLFFANWMEGVMLCGVYLVAGFTFFFLLFKFKGTSRKGIAEKGQGYRKEARGGKKTLPTSR